MVASATLEKPQTNVRFESVTELKQELTKQSQNTDRLREFQLAIDEAIVKDKKITDEKHVIEFTQKEWNDLIADDNLPPLEELKSLLRKKIEGVKKVTAETKEKQKGLFAGLKGKKEEIKEKVGSLENKGKKLLTDKKNSLIEKMSPVDKIKLSWNALTFGVKFAWYGFWANIGFDWAKKGLATLVEEKAKQGVEGAKKALEKINGKKEDGEKGTLEKYAPAAILGGLATGLFTMLHLPKSITDKIGDPKDGGEILKKASKFRKLKLFGVGGTMLVAAGLLYAHFESHPETLAELGEIPTDAAGKKSWWQKALDKAKIGAKEGGDKLLHVLTSGLDLVDGKALRNHYESKGPAEGYEFLSESSLVQGMKDKAEAFERRLIGAYQKDKAFYNTVIAAMFIAKPGLIRGSISEIMKVGNLMRKIALGGVGQLAHHPLRTGLLFALATNSIEAFKHIQIKKDMTEEEAIECVEDALDLDDFQKDLDEGVDKIPSEHIKPVAKSLLDGGKSLYSQFDDWIDSWETNLPDKMKELLIRTDAEKISSKNKNGLEYFLNALLSEKDKISNYERLIGKDGKSGVLRKILAKSKFGVLITEGDIYELIEAARGTDIMIFPENNSREKGRTIMWARINEKGVPKGFGNNLCINPLTSHTTQLESVEKWVIDPADVGIKGSIGKIFDGSKREFEELVKAGIDTMKGATLLEKMILGGYNVVVFGGTTYLEYFGRKYILGPLSVLKAINHFKGDKISFGEALVEYGQGLAPVLIISTWNSLRTGKGFLGLRNQGGFLKMVCNNTLAETIFYPIKGILGTIKGIGTGVRIGGHILDRAFAGNYIDILKDPAVMIKDAFMMKIHRILGVAEHGKFLSIEKWGKAKRIQSQMEELRIKMTDAKMALEYGFRRGNNNRFDRLTTSIKKMLERTEYDELKALIGYKEISANPEEFRALYNRIEDVYKKSIFDVEKLRVYAEKEIKEKADQFEEHYNKNHLLNDQIDKMSPEEQKKYFEKNEEHIKEMQKNVEKSDRFLKEAENEFNENKSNNVKKDRYEKIKAEHERLTTNLDVAVLEHELGVTRGYVKPLEIHPNIKPGHVGRLRGIGGVLLFGLGGGYALSKAADYIKGDSHQLPREKTESDEDFYGFQKGSTKTSAENIRDEDEKKNNSLETEGQGTELEKYKTPEEFNRHMDEISRSYREDLKNFFDSKWVKTASESEVKKTIESVADNHMKHVGAIKSMIHNNKGLMEAFWKKNFVDDKTGEEIIPEDIRKSGVKAFMFIHKKNGELVLDYMDHQDIKNVLHTLYEGHRDHLVREKGEWVKDHAGGATDFVLRVAPFTGSAMSGVDAYDSFKKGDIKAGVWNTLWCVGGLALDIFTFGTGGTAARTAVGVGRVATNTVVHTSVMLGGQFAQELTRHDRSESVKVSEL